MLRVNVGKSKVMRCERYGNVGGMDVRLNGELLYEVDCFTYVWLQWVANGGRERGVVHRMNEGFRPWGVLKSVLSNRGLGINATKCLYETVIVSMALYGAEAWGTRSKVNVLEMKCLRSLVGLSRMDRVRNEEVHRRAGIERELASRADQRVLRLFGHTREIMNTVWLKLCKAEVS